MDINTIAKNKDWNIFNASHYCRLSQLNTSDRLKKYLLEAEAGIKNSNDKEDILAYCYGVLYVGFLDDCTPSYIFSAIKNTLSYYNKLSIVNIDDLLSFKNENESSIPVNTPIPVNCAMPITANRDFNSSKISPADIINNIAMDSARMASNQQPVPAQQPTNTNVMQLQNALQNIMRHINFVKKHDIDINDINALTFLINHSILNTILLDNGVNMSVPYIQECIDYVPTDKNNYQFFVNLPKINMKLYIKFSTKLQNNSYPLEYNIK